MKLSEMKQLLAREEIQLTRSLGQNFLHDANQLQRIIDLAELKKTDQVLEIGPGLGPLTERLLEKSAHVLAIEKDARLVAVLRRRFANVLEAPASESVPGKPGGIDTASFTLLHDDALDYLQKEPRDWSQWKLVANLPYSVASPIIVELARPMTSPSRLVATLQLEVAKRLMAGPDSADYGVLTLLVQAEYEPQQWFKIPAGSFFPEPDVDSACVCLTRRAQPIAPGSSRSTFTRIVKRSFSQRRKMMLKLLKQDWAPDRLQAAFEQLQITPGARAEHVSLEQFGGLTDLLTR